MSKYKMIKFFIKNNLSIFLISVLVVSFLFIKPSTVQAVCAELPVSPQITSFTVNSVSGAPVSTTSFTLQYNAGCAFGEWVDADWTVTVAGRDVSGFTARCPQNPGPCTIIQTINSNIDISGLANGPYTASVYVINGYGNTATATYDFTINFTASCSVSYFSKLSHDGYNKNTIGWSVSGVSSVNISGIGTNQPAVGTASNVGPGTYVLSGTGCTDSTLIIPSDPVPVPTLKAIWNETNSTTINKTALPGGVIPLNFTFSNIGQPGSVITVRCPKGAIASEIGTNNVTSPICPDVVLTVPIP